MHTLAQIDYEEFIKWYRAQQTSVDQRFNDRAELIPDASGDGQQRVLPRSKLSELCDDLGVPITSLLRRRFFPVEDRKEYVTHSQFLRYYLHMTGREHQSKGLQRSQSVEEVLGGSNRLSWTSGEKSVSQLRKELLQLPKAVVEETASKEDRDFAARWNRFFDELHTDAQAVDGGTQGSTNPRACTGSESTSRVAIIAEPRPTETSMDVALPGAAVALQSRELSASIDPGLSTDLVVRTTGSTDLLGQDETALRQGAGAVQQVRRAQPQDTQLSWVRRPQPQGRVHARLEVRRAQPQDTQVSTTSQPRFWSV